MNVLTEIMVSRFLLQRSSARFPNFEEKKQNKKTRKSLKFTPTHQMEDKNLWQG